jgi:uncharacterized protein (DUF342 family)
VAEPVEITVAGRDGVPVAVRTLLRESDSARELHLVATPDNMHAYLRVSPRAHFAGVAREAVVSAVAAGGITRGLIDAGVDLLVNLQNSAAPFDGYFEVACGVPMQRGENGSVEFHVQPTSMEPRYDENDDGRVDFRQLNLIENCFVGQRVASILPPGTGRAGADLFGRSIPPVPGEPVGARPGAGVTVSPNGREFTSQVEGRVVYEDGVLSVSPLLEIGRDIDYSVGNIDFIGKVTVRGNLLDGFAINAKRGVELFGEMGASRITSEGDVKITGGVKGKTAGIISCRNLAVHYIDDATVEASGDVTATKEIMNSSVKALGSVRVTAGAIIGGDITGFRGVEADTIGSEMGVATRVAAGVNWTEENTKAGIRAKMAELLDRAQSAKTLLAPLFADSGAKAGMNSEQKALLADLISELQDLRSDMAELLEERRQLGGSRPAGAVNQINVRKMLYMGVDARFSVAGNKGRDDIKGPLSLTQDESRDIVSTGAWHKLPEREPAEGEAGGAPA